MIRGINGLLSLVSYVWRGHDTSSKAGRRRRMSKNRERAGKSDRDYKILYSILFCLLTLHLFPFRFPINTLYYGFYSIYYLCLIFLVILSHSFLGILTLFSTQYSSHLAFSVKFCAFVVFSCCSL